MQRRIFTRRRHAINVATGWLKLLKWLSVPAIVAAYFWEVLNWNGLPIVGLSVLFGLGLAYGFSVLKIHDLSGEWRFY